MLATSGSTCLVTGAAGFIGSHIAERLVRLGHHVRAVDNLSTGHEANLASVNGRIDFIHGDLCDPVVCRRATAGIDVVFHLAALPSVPLSLLDPWNSHAANVNATMRLLEACVEAKVSRVVYSSSSAVYGDGALEGPRTEQCEVAPRSPYAASKLAGEQYVLAFARAGTVEGVALRYFNVFGLRQRPNSAYAAVIPNFLHAALTKTPAMLFGDGGQTRDFVHVDNVVDANLLAAGARAQDVNGWVMNIGEGRSTSLLELLELIAVVSGREVRYTVGPVRPGDVRDSMADVSRAARLLGYRARVTLEEGLRQMWLSLSGRGTKEPATNAPMTVNQSI
jgi:UDP-glucose 4-epimerase